MKSNLQPAAAGDEPQNLVLEMTTEEMQEASERAAMMLDMIFANNAPQEVVKRLFLNMHGVLTALCERIHGDTIQSIIRDVLLVNVASVQRALDARDAIEGETKH